MADAPWMDRWKRSPRQDRRVVENGKFVELGKVHLPEPPVEEVPEQEQSALELVTEAPKVPEREQSVSEASQAELEPLDAVKAHQEGSQTIAEIADAVMHVSPMVEGEDFILLDPSEVPANSVIVGTLHDETLTEEQSDALAETLRLPEPVEDEVQDR